MEKIPSLPPQLSLDDDLTIPLAQRRTVATLQSNSCRWPFGDPVTRGFYFCGKQTPVGCPYCEFHMRRAFRSAQKRGT
jgi:GcrA cell cycle regulator